VRYLVLWFNCYSLYNRISLSLERLSLMLGGFLYSDCLRRLVGSCMHGIIFPRVRNCIWHIFILTLLPFSCLRPAIFAFARLHALILTNHDLMIIVNIFLIQPLRILFDILMKWTSRIGLWHWILRQWNDFDIVTKQVLSLCCSIVLVLLILVYLLCLSFYMSITV